jgi:catalase
MDLRFSSPYRPNHGSGGCYPLAERVDELAPERRKIIFDPVPRVDGIDPAGDPLTDVRSDIYLLSGRRRRSDAAK